MAFSLMSCDQWVHNMRQDPTFHVDHARNLGEWQPFDALLCQLLSDHLGRRISLIPFLEEDQQKTFFPKKFQLCNNFRPFALLQQASVCKFLCQHLSKRSSEC